MAPSGVVTDGQQLTFTQRSKHKAAAVIIVGSIWLLPGVFHICSDSGVCSKEQAGLLKTSLLSPFWWLQGHVYSLGSTLSAALTYIMEPELEAELGEEIQRLLQQMQEEAPEERPLLQV